VSGVTAIGQLPLINMMAGIALPFAFFATYNQGSNKYFIEVL
jgi:hypothetical protein